MCFSCLWEGREAQWVAQVGKRIPGLDCSELFMGCVPVEESIFVVLFLPTKMETDV